MSGMSGMSMSEDDVDYELPQDVADRLVKRTELRVSQVISQSNFVQTNCCLYELPRFEREELDIGPMIAYGGFSNVHEIEGFKVETPLNQGVNKKNEYIIKHLNPKLAFNPKKLVVGAKDLVMEAHFLSSLEHDNVIRLRGWSASGIAGFASTGRADGFFLVFDRLTSTLSKRISIWREESKKRVKTSLMKSNKSAARMQLFNERLQTAIDISSAISYLHAKRVLYRDLKPANVGFDAADTLKIFDFGLAVELPESSDPNQTYNLAGNTGTSRYMAVEIIRKQPVCIVAAELTGAENDDVIYAYSHTIAFLIISLFSTTVRPMYGVSRFSCGNSWRSQSLTMVLSAIRSKNASPCLENDLPFQDHGLPKSDDCCDVDGRKASKSVLQCKKP